MNFWAEPSKKGVFNSITVKTRCLLTDRNIDTVLYQVLISADKVNFLTDRNTALGVGLAGQLFTDSSTKNDEKGYFLKLGCAHRFHRLG